MADAPETGIYLIVDFDWPQPITKEHAAMSKKLHDLVEKNDWIEERVAGYGGLGGEQACIWVFKLPDYAALDRLLNNRQDPVSQAYVDFFSAMRNVRDRIRDEVAFI